MMMIMLLLLLLLVMMMVIQVCSGNSAIISCQAPTCCTAVCRFKAVLDPLIEGLLPLLVGRVHCLLEAGGLWDWSGRLAEPQAAAAASAAAAAASSAAAAGAGAVATANGAAATAAVAGRTSSIGWRELAAVLCLAACTPRWYPRCVLCTGVPRVLRLQCPPSSSSFTDPPPQSTPSSQLGLILVGQPS